MNRIIEISIRDRIAWQTNREEYICDNSDFAVAFDFDSEWENVEPKTARFIHGESYTDVVFTGNQCPVPVITDATKMAVGVFAGNVKTTTPATVICKKSILCGDGVPADPTPDVYTQIMEVIVPEAVLKAEESAKAAETAKTCAETAQANAERAANSIKPPDWNASKNSPGYIENRTHYETSTIEIVPVSGVWESYKVASGETHWVYLFTEQLNLVDGARYTVTFGTRGFQCTARKGDKYISLSNVGVSSVPENYRFMIFAYFEKQADGYWGDLSMMDGNKSDFTIYENKTTVHKLDEKYMPDSVATKEYVDTAIKNIDIPEPETAQPDWNAAEGELGHVANRTHWVEGGMVEILAECQPEFTDDTGNMGVILQPFDLTLGESYMVKLNGVEYKTIGFNAGELEEQYEGCIALVNEGANLETFEALAFVIIDTPTLEATYGWCGVLVLETKPTEAVTISITHNAEVVHKLDGKFLPDGVPYVEQGGWVDILPECQPVYIEDEAMFMVTEGVQELSAGETYIVRWNGTEYTCVGQDASALAPGAVFLGNFAAVSGSGDSGEPFAIGGAQEDGIYTIMIMPVDGTTELTISITHNAEVVHKLPCKFLPDGVPYVEQGAMKELPVVYNWANNSAAQIVDPIGLQAGNTYTVVWDGIAYEVTAREEYVEGIPAIVLGNSTGETTEPFVIVELLADIGTGICGMAMDVNGGAYIDFSIKGKSVKVNKLDNRCLDMDYIKESLNVAADTVKVNLADMGLEVVNLGRTIGTTGFANLIRDVVGPITRGAKVLLDFKYNFIGTERTYHGYVTDWEVVELYGEAATTVHVLEGNDIYLIRLHTSLDLGRVQTNVHKLALEPTATEV